MDFLDYSCYDWCDFSSSRMVFVFDTSNNIVNYNSFIGTNKQCDMYCTNSMLACIHCSWIDNKLFEKIKMVFKI